jgi:hypothetical protein
MRSCSAISVPPSADQQQSALSRARHSPPHVGYRAIQVAAAVGYTPPASIMAAPSDGLFWIEFKDFAKHFKELTFCCA